MVERIKAVMIKITLPDGTIREYPAKVTGLQIAEDIGPGLLRAALAISVNSNLQDLSVEIEESAEVRLITGKDAEGLEIIRHDTAHIIAQAVKELYPETQITIGPVIDNGFYYDFSRETPFSPEDLEKIEQRMLEIVKKDYPFTREIWSRDKAIKFFKREGEHYKAEIIQDLPEDQPISIYRQGDFIDLCRGPHAPSTGKKKAFKLTKLAGAYWRGNSNNEMLQRIYGTAWLDDKQLKSYLHRIEEAEKRDHRKIGKELDLFHIQEEASGQIFWHPKGWTLYRIIEDYIRNKVQKDGYDEIKTPIMADKSLWEKSGHWDKFRENMFVVENEGKTLCIKPMSCPFHVQIFKQHLKSYRDLPLRFAEFGCCHRNESSGSMHGLMRVRGMTQDDGHIFCTEEQITEETVKFCELLKAVYKDFGFKDIHVKFSDRPDVRAGTDEVWDKAESSLKKAIEAAQMDYTMNPKEGAFYGPKLEFILKDALEREWQCGTLQLDFVLPDRLEASYIGSDGSKHAPVMLHRAILGTLERFIGVLIENYAGKFPLWLSPVQVMVTTITDEANNYANAIKGLLTEEGIRAEIDLSGEKINYKIRQHSLAKIPIILTVGKKEVQDKTVSIRRLGQDRQIVTLLEDFIKELKDEVVVPS
jgi:threonyl-tRNA synthetase